MTLLLGYGDGGFAPQPSFNAGVTPSAVATGDFNGDGNLDFIESNYNGGTVSCFLGYGDGGFAPRRSVDPGTNPHGVGVGDFNRDGFLDLAVATTFNSMVSVFPGNGDGTFSNFPTSYPTGVNPESVAVGDLNGDGVLDLAVLNSNGSQGEVSGSVSVFIGFGDGGFTAQANYSAGVTPATIALGDFNGDHILDLVESNSNGGTVSPLLGYGDGGFAPRTLLDSDFGPGSVATADFNGDGISDVVIGATPAFGAANEIEVFLSLGNGNFTLPMLTTVGTGPNAVAVGDFNGDGRPDLAVANLGQNTVTVLISQCGP